MRATAATGVSVAAASSIAASENIGIQFLRKYDAQCLLNGMATAKA